MVRIALDAAAFKCESRDVIIFSLTTVAARARRTFSLVRKPYYHCSSSFERRAKQSRLRRAVLVTMCFFFFYAESRRPCEAGERRTRDD